MLLMFITLEVFQDERLREKSEAALPAKSNIYSIFSTLIVFQEERLRAKLEIDELNMNCWNMWLIFVTLEVSQEEGSKTKVLTEEEAPTR